MAKKKAAPKATDLTGAIANIKKQFGDEALVSMDQRAEIPCYSTGSIRLDRALGRGVPKGRVIELFGPESSGKTTLCLAIAAQAQKEGDPVFIVDAEHSFDPEWAQKIGMRVDADMLQVSQPGSGEEGWQIVDALAHAGAPLVILDSVAALVPKAELEGEIGDAHVGLQARMNSQAMRKMAPVCEKNNCTLLLVNQVRENVGGNTSFGPTKTTPGGRAIKHAASQRLDVVRIAMLKSGEEIIGQTSKIKVAKNKVAAPFKTVNLDIYFHCGPSFEAELIDLAIDGKILKQSGAWIKYGNENLAQGKEKARQRLAEDSELRDEIYQKLRELDD